jgi:hypothetical protein
MRYLIVLLTAIFLIGCGDETETLDIDRCELISLKIGNADHTEWICNTKEVANEKI